MDDEERKRHGVPWAAVIVMLLLIGYPLSIGPAIPIHKRLSDTELQNRIVDAYGPVRWLASRSQWSQRVFEWYCDLWE